MTATQQPRPLTVELIVEAALGIADREGLAAVSMRRVADVVGAGAMSLYRHVQSKEVLLELMADHVLAGLPEVDRDEPWQAALERFYLAFHDLLREHPAVAHVMLERSVAGRQITRRGESVLACLVHGGLADATAVAAFTALTWFTLGGSLYAIARGGGEGAADARVARFAGLAPEEFPTINRVAPHFARDASREHFREGLVHLIRGYEEA